MDAPVATAQVPVEKNGERGRAVEAAILQIEKQCGRGSIMRLGDREAQNVASISTGSVALDLALGVGAGQARELTEDDVGGHAGQESGHHRVGHESHVPPEAGQTRGHHQETGNDRQQEDGGGPVLG